MESYSLRYIWYMIVMVWCCISVVANISKQFMLINLHSKS